MRKKLYVKNIQLAATITEAQKIGEKHFTRKYPAIVAEWVYERLQIQVAESHRSQVPKLLETYNYDGKIVTKKQLFKVRIEYLQLNND